MRRQITTSTPAAVALVALGLGSAVAQLLRGARRVWFTNLCASRWRISPEPT